MELRYEAMEEEKNLLARLLPDYGSLDGLFCIFCFAQAVSQCGDAV